MTSDALEYRKCKLLKKTFEDLGKVIELCWGREDGDHNGYYAFDEKGPECHSMILGSILRSLGRTGFYPLPQAPYLLFEIGETIRRLEGLQILSPCPKHCAQIARSRILRITEDLRNGVSGFELEDFKSTDWR